MDPRSIPLEVAIAVAAAFALLAATQTARLAWRRFWQRRTLALRRERGAAGEVRAEAILRRLGYTILGRQVGVSYGVAIDGERVAIDLRADYVVGLRDRRFVAEVKTGRLAPRIDTPATRRQLLEYRVAFDVDGVLLVDADAGLVRAVVFPLPSIPARSTRAPLAWLAAGVVIGLCAAAAGLLAIEAGRSGL